MNTVTHPLDLTVAKNSRSETKAGFGRSKAGFKLFEIQAYIQSQKAFESDSLAIEVVKVLYFTAFLHLSSRSKESPKDKLRPHVGLDET